MSDIAISVENVSKMYRLGNYGTNTLGDDITRFWAKTRGKEDPFAKIAEANDRSKKMESDYVWSLKDVSFEVKKGESLGILGRNGAGKSTLLKILSRITTPSTGNIKVDGRIASLLEVGTGFNPDLTGRENAYMNGAILGMNRKEVASKLDQIIDFSGVEGYIDTPVKRYSSGMYVRLAFSVAAHLNTEILILDEVLSVGDVEFQRKCANKIDSICKKEGKTIIFVSHALATIEQLCNKVIYLKSGELIHVGPTAEIVPIYKEALMVVELENLAKEKADRIARGEEEEGVVEEEVIAEEEILDEEEEIIELEVSTHDRTEIFNQNWTLEQAPGTGKIALIEAKITSDKLPFMINKPLELSFKFYSKVNQLVNLSLHLKTLNGDIVFNSITKPQQLGSDYYTSKLTIPPDLLNDGFYIIDLYFVDYKELKAFYIVNDLLRFELREPERQIAWKNKWQGFIRPTMLDFEIINS